MAHMMLDVNVELLAIFWIEIFDLDFLIFEKT